MANVLAFIDKLRKPSLFAKVLNIYMLDDYSAHLDASVWKNDVVLRIVISCVVAHALHAWLLVSPSMTTRSLITNRVANMRCLMATRSLITNPLANMRCACKASEHPPRSLIRDRSSIADTRVMSQKKVL